MPFRWEMAQASSSKICSALRITCVTSPSHLALVEWWVCCTKIAKALPSTACNMQSCQSARTTAFASYTHDAHVQLCWEEACNMFTSRGIALQLQESQAHVFSMAFCRCGCQGVQTQWYTCQHHDNARHIAGDHSAAQADVCAPPAAAQPSLARWGRAVCSSPPWWFPRFQKSWCNATGCQQVSKLINEIDSYVLAAEATLHLPNVTATVLLDSLTAVCSCCLQAKAAVSPPTLQSASITGMMMHLCCHVHSLQS